jgi:hypothetical protein
VLPGHVEINTELGLVGPGVRALLTNVLAWPLGFGFSVEFWVDATVRPHQATIAALSNDLDFYRYSRPQPPGRCRVSLQTSSSENRAGDALSLRYNGGNFVDGHARTKWAVTPLPIVTDTVSVTVDWPNLELSATFAHIPGSVLHEAAAASTSFD